MQIKHKRLITLFFAVLILTFNLGTTVNAERNNGTEETKQGWYRNRKTDELRYYDGGEPVTGFAEINGKIYFFNSKGNMIVNKWIKHNNSVYYFGENGRALTGRQIINGKEFTFDESSRYLCRHIDTDIVDSSDGFYTYAEMSDDIARLLKIYPDIIQCNVIGTTADKRNIYDIVMGNPDADKQVVVQASCHAREYMTSLLVMEQLEYCLNKYYTGTYNGVLFKDLFNEYAFHIIPMLNPDGVTISQYGKNGLRSEILRKNAEVYYRNAVTWGYTNYSESQYYQRWKANARGVDINSNFNGRWDEIKLLNGPCGWGYKGDFPECEIESKCIADLIRSLSNPVTVISYHATGSVIWWDYGQAGDFRSRCIKQLNTVENLTGYRRQPYSPYSAGGLSDWIIADSKNSTVPQTIEIGVDMAPLKDSEYPAVWQRNYLIFPAVAYLYYYE